MQHACFSGVVVSGHKRGRLLGFPTANVAAIDPGALPPDGVYAGFVHLPHPMGCYGATISLGWNQTFHDVMDHRIEAHIHDFSGEIYGAAIVVTIVKRLRDMMGFRDAEALIRQIERDVQQSRLLLAARSPGEPAIPQLVDAPSCQCGPIHALRDIQS